MLKRIEVRKPTPYSVSLRARSLHQRDIRIFSDMYGVSDSEACSTLINDGFDGRWIRNRFFYLGNPKDKLMYLNEKRSTAARKVFEMFYGLPVPRKKS